MSTTLVCTSYYRKVMYHFNSSRGLQTALRSCLDSGDTRRHTIKIEHAHVYAHGPTTLPAQDTGSPRARPNLPCLKVTPNPEPLPLPLTPNPEPRTPNPLLQSYPSLTPNP